MGLTWTLRYFMVILAVVAATLTFAVAVYPDTPSDQCILLQVYGIGEGKLTQPLPCDWMGVRYVS